MELSVEIEARGVGIQIVGQDPDSVREELEKFFETLNSLEGLLPNPHQQAAEASQTSPSSPSVTPDAPQADDAIKPIVKDTNIQPEELKQVLHVDPEFEDPPTVLVDDPDETWGPNNKDKQLPATLIVLYIWEKAYGRDPVPSTEVRDALEVSDIDPSSLYNIYDNTYIKQLGSQNKELALTHKGKLEAKQEIRELTEAE